MSAFDEFVQAAFLATDTRSDVFHSAFVSLLRPIRIGKKRTTEHDHVAFAVAESFFRKVGITEFAYRNDRNRKSAVCFDVVFGKVFFDDFRNVQKASGRHGRRRMRQPPVVVATEVDVEHINARFHEVFHIGQSLLAGTFVFELFERTGGVHSVFICGVEGKAQVDTVHNRITSAHAATNFLHHVDAELFVVAVTSQNSAVEGRVGALFEKVAFVAVQIHAVDVAGLRVCRALADVFDDFLEAVVGKSEARNIFHVPVRVEACASRQLHLVGQTLRIAHSAEARGKLNEEMRAVSVSHARKISPSGKNRSGPVDTREIAEVAQFYKRLVDAERNRNKAGSKKARPASCSFFKIFEHFGVRSAGFVAHGNVSHRRHNQAVFQSEGVHSDRAEHRVVRIKILGHTRFFEALFPPVGIVGGKLLEFVFIVCVHILSSPA